MRIILFVPFRAEGGSLKNLVQLLSAWNRHGAIAQHTVILHAVPESIQRIISQTGPVAGMQTVPILQSASQGIGRLIYDWLSAARNIMPLRPDVIFCPGGTAPRGVTAPTVVNYQNLLPLENNLYAATQDLRLFASQFILRRMFRRSLRAATAPIFNSTHAHHQFEALMGHSLPDARVIPRAMELPTPDLPGATELIEKISSATPFVVSVGHLYPYKKYDTLIRGFAEHVRQTGENINYLIAGGFATPGLDEKLLALARELGVEKRVQLLGPQPYNLSLGLIARAEAFLFGSTVENCPNALLEAMAMAKPIICSDRSSMPEFSGDTVMYVNPDVPQEITAGLRRLRDEPEAAASLGKAAYKRVHEMPGVDAMASATLQAILDAASLRPFPRQ